MTQLPFEDLPRLSLSGPAISFDEFYAAYPRKVGKRKAAAAYKKALDRTSSRQILEGLERYKRNKPAYCDWMHPTTFLNGDHWEDEYDSPKRQPDTPESLAIIAAHAKRTWCKRGQYPRDVLQQCVDAGLLTVDEMEDVL